MYEERSYRKHYNGQGLTFFDVCVMETDLRIGADKNLSTAAIGSVELYRRQLKEYIKLQPEFLTSLKPIEPLDDSPVIVRKMCNAARLANVGPMAAVAGGISELVGDELMKYSDNVIIENGGDLFIKTTVPRKIGIYAGKSKLSNKLALCIGESLAPIGVCTSAGTVGHSLSFGKADAALVVSKNTFLADAAATALGNLVKAAEDIDSALDNISRINGVLGALVIIDDKLGCWGEIELAKC